MAFRKIQPAESKYENTSDKKFRRIDDSENSNYQQSRAGSVFNAGSKGLVQGLSDLGELYGGEDTHSEILKELYGASPEQVEELKDERRLLGQESLEKFLPSKEGQLESLTRRGARMIPGFLAGPGSTASKVGGAIGGATAGHIAEESGAGDWGQAAAEIIGSMLGGSPSGQLRPRTGSREASLINTARNRGLTEAQIAPAIQSNRKIGTFAPIAHKGPSTIRRIAESRTALGGLYQQMENSQAGRHVISVGDRTNILNDLSAELQNLPNAVRDTIARDAMDMLRSTPSVANMMNFYRDVNYQIGRGHTQLGGVRRILENNLSRYLGEDFRHVNELFGNVRRLGIRLRPDLASHFHDFRIASDLSEAIITEDKRSLTRVLGEIFGKFTSSKILTSPYMQHIPMKLLDSARNGSFESAKKILTIMLNKGEEDDSSSSQKHVHKQ